MTTIGGDEPVGRGNRYCERVGLASVPRVEAVLDRDLDKDDINLFRLMVVALLEHGRPMTVEEIAERLSRAGAIARSGNMVLALKRAWHGREPVWRDPDGRLGLNLMSSELERLLWHTGLRPPLFEAPEPAKVGAPVDLVVGSTPGWSDPWSRAHRGFVIEVEPWQVTVSLNDVVCRFDRREIQAARIARGTDGT